MLKNNLKALAIHIGISVLVIVATVVYVFIDMHYGQDGYDQAFMYIVAAVAGILYAVFSSAILTNLRSVWRNIVSVALVSLVGVILWVISYFVIVDPNSGGLHWGQYAGLEWGLYMVYNPALLPIALMFSETSAALPFLVGAFAPSLLLWLGLYVKRK